MSYYRPDTLIDSVGPKASSKITEVLQTRIPFNTPSIDITKSAFDLTPSTCLI